MDIDGKQVNWLGHAGILIQQEEKTIYIDPYQISKAAPQATHVFLTHDHYDHLSEEDLDIICTTETKIICPPHCRPKLASISKSELKTIEPGDEIEVDDITVQALPSYNINKSFHPKEKENLAFVITISDTKFFHMGDTDKIPEHEGVEADVTFIPVSGKYVMNAEQAIEAAKKIKSKLFIPVHWGSIIGDLTDAENFKKKSKKQVEILKKKVF